MKAVLTNTEDTILIDNIDPKEHIVVMITQEGAPGILTTRHSIGKFYFLCLNRETTLGNSWTGAKSDGFSSVPQAIETQLNADRQVHVFKNSEWKKALQFLIDNSN